MFERKRIAVVFYFVSQSMNRDCWRLCWDHSWSAEHRLGELGIANMIGPRRCPAFR